MLYNPNQKLDPDLQAEAESIHYRAGSESEAQFLLQRLHEKQAMRNFIHPKDDVTGAPLVYGRLNPVKGCLMIIVILLSLFLGAVWWQGKLGVVFQWPPRFEQWGFGSNEQKSLTLGGFAVTSDLTGKPLIIHIEPGINERETGRIPEGVKVSVIDGPRSKDSYHWYFVRSEQHGEGWVAGEYLTPLP